MTWAILPYLDCPDLTRQAVLDLLLQTEETQILLIDNGSQTLEGIDLAHDLHTYSKRVWTWRHDPPMPSLAACWNHALEMMWATGQPQALVINNDVRLHPQMLQGLIEAQRLTQGWFVSATNVGEDWERVKGIPILPFDEALPAAKGGPDFSCFLITRECHSWFQFDEGFQPAYHEDNDYHRRLELAGFGDRIFSLPIPYQHFGSGTLNGNPAMRAEWGRKFEACQRYYIEKWGGLPHHETFQTPFDQAVSAGGVFYEPWLLTLGQGRGELSLATYHRAKEVLRGQTD